MHNFHDVDLTAVVVRRIHTVRIDALHPEAAPEARCCWRHLDPCLEIPELLPQTNFNGNTANSDGEPSSWISGF
jgi:hypothetical protein